MIKIKHVTEVYEGTHKAVDDISSTIPTGEIIGPIGPNGVGKTATIKVITSMLNPGEGEVLINGKNIVKEPLEARKEFGIVPDSADIFLWSKGLKYLNFMEDIYGVDGEQHKQRITSFAETFEMKDALNDHILSCPHGMRQKIVIMGVPLSDPNVWILDEPMTGLGPQSPYPLKEMVKKHTCKGNTIFFFTHVLRVVERSCDKVAIVSRGCIVFFGTSEELKQLHP